MVTLVAAWLLSTQAGSGQITASLQAPAVILQVTMPSGTVNRLTIQSGKHGSVGIVNGPALDLSPTLNDDGTVEVTVTPLTWDGGANGFASGTLDAQVLRTGESVAFANGPFVIEVKWVGTVSPAGADASAAGADPAERCCVICGSDVICGCVVVTPCGNCCSGSCGCPDGSVKRSQ